jgi:Protein of unknown function (DUF3500)
MDRKTFLKIAALGASTAFLGERVQAQITQGLAVDMAQAATRFLASLSSSHRSKTSFTFSSAERTRWHWTTTSAVPRNGLALRDMSTESRTLALALLRASLSEAGYKQAVAIIALQLELGQDDGLYYISVFGTPSSSTWGWRFEGHHLSRHFTIKDTALFLTPFFLGSYPTETDSKFRAMPREEDAARELVRSLRPEQRKIAVFQEESLTQHITQNAVRVKPLPALGIEMSALSAAQQNLVLEIIRTFLGTLPEGVGKPLLERLQKGFSSIRFAWAGSFEPRNPHYYRLQGNDFLLEFDNSRNSGTHIHSVWRDFTGDFGM